MKSFIVVSSAILASLNLAAAVPAAAPAVARDAISVSVSYDPAYDVSTTSLDNTACGSMLTHTWPTFGNVPGFPHIGGALTIEGSGSLNCGKCYQLHYSGNGVDETITVLAIDKATGAFNIGLQAMNDLTNGQAEQLGRVTATYTEVPASQCGVA
ncbi:Heat-stable 19 kDa antigen [Penicillium cataractarum]|uniref:Heat-stable 19 kDa antigen n=1 Tax=Penicillium cataractarum TaxID=2100454 RepID=A0A9W9UZP4_9EURO|nr:Heat-stable 19 kDa antigen [Penicillium cataractarum]KAJ5363477.1 Heat-stable 19 kDa antigen [Penicillium cataractarum]